MLNFGKYKGKTLFQVINNGGVIYDGWKEDFRKEMIENDEL